MGRLSKLCLALVALCGALLSGSCQRDPSDNERHIVLNESPVVMFHISTLNAGGAASKDVSERIKTLRIIMIHESGGETRIEANRLIDAHDTPDNTFSYIFQKRTVAGKKRFYLIANESSVGEVSATAGTIPEELVNPDLTTLLNYFDPDMPTDDDEEAEADAAEPKYSAADFEKLLNSLCFEALPAYGIIEGEGDGSDVVYLPYSALYSVEIKASDALDADYTGTPMYLVPAVTKFAFTFINERTQDDVAIDYLAINSLNESTYLMANLEDWEKTKYISGDEYYWIDWLKYVADETTGKSDLDENLDINSRYGWISDYNVPHPEDAYVHYIVPDGPADDPEVPYVKSTSWILPRANDSTGGKVESTTTSFGPFYLPESHFMAEKDIVDASGNVSSQTVESYTLMLKMRNSGANVDEESLVEVKKAETEISNLKSLFRNTSMLITITLREGGVNIYAEAVPWNKKTFFGYVKDEDEIK